MRFTIQCFRCDTEIEMNFMGKLDEEAILMMNSEVVLCGFCKKVFPTEAQERYEKFMNQELGVKYGPFGNSFEKSYLLDKYKKILSDRIEENKITFSSPIKKHKITLFLNQ